MEGAIFYLYILGAVLATFARIWLLMGVSILIALIMGILAARVRSAGAIIIPLTNVLQAVPVVSFFPIILVFFLVRVPGGLGIELASDFLIITALVWNLILGVYEAVSHIPEHFDNVGRVYRISLWSKIKKLYMPASYPTIVSNIMPSFASGLFYITLSEVIAIGSRTYQVFGVGGIAQELVASYNFGGVLVLLGMLVVGISLNFYFIINPLLKRTEKYTFDTTAAIESREERRIRENVFLSNISRRVNQVVNTSVSAVTAINRFMNPRSRRERRRSQFPIPERSLNIVVGLLLVASLSTIVYLIARSGFAEAFTSYLLNIGFIKSLIIGVSYDLLRVLIVFALSLVTMVPLAMYFGNKGQKSKMSTGVFQILYSIPAPIFYPLIVVFLTPFLAKYMGADLAFEVNVIIITFLSAAAYIFFNVYGAVRAIPTELKTVTKVFGLKRSRITRYLTFPASIPALITGSMAAIGSYWGGLMVGEYTVVGDTHYSVSTGLMAMLDKAIATNNLLEADAIDIFMVVIIVAISFLLFRRLYSYSKRKYTY
ncbi:hypothetical protein IX51_05360 [uncultured archaeon]|nr:hypothetical protein IX51_05360 [uncultured archaeon]